jgi:hypothetical protein
VRDRVRGFNPGHDQGELDGTTPGGGQALTRNEARRIAADIATPGRLKLQRVPSLEHFLILVIWLAHPIQN